MVMGTCKGRGHGKGHRSLRNERAGKRVTDVTLAVQSAIVEINGIRVEPFPADCTQQEIRAACVQDNVLTETCTMT